MECEGQDLLVSNLKPIPAAGTVGAESPALAEFLPHEFGADHESQLGVHVRPEFMWAPRVLPSSQSWVFQVAGTQTANPRIILKVGHKFEALARFEAAAYRSTMRGEVTAVIEPADEGGFWAICPEVPGANGQGETVEVTKQNLAAAIRLLMENQLARKICRRLGLPDAS